MIREAEPADANAVIALWHACGLTRPWNDPAADLARALACPTSTVLLLERDGAAIGTVMAGYDGHRGWLYSIAVHPQARRSGLGASLVGHAERALAALGCMKINLQLLATNAATADFYRSIGYSVEPRLSMGKVLHENVRRPGEV